MMNYTSKLAYLLGLPVFVGASILCSMNVVNSVNISIPLESQIHRTKLHSLYLGSESYSTVKVSNGVLSVLNGIIMGENSSVGVNKLVSIGGGKNNVVNGDMSGIGGGYGNRIKTPRSIIGGGSGNVIEGGTEIGVVAGGLNNKVSSGGIVAGGSNNDSRDGGTVIGGSSNQSYGRNGLVLGRASKGGEGSFSWNSTIMSDNSAIIMAKSGVLIGTYQPIQGVNLVVNGAMRIGSNSNLGIAGEIRIQSGCFYAYDGKVWHVLNRGKGSAESCPSVTCDFGSTLLQEGDKAIGYREPYAEKCAGKKVSITCNSDGTMGNGGVEYYPYCYELSGSGIPNNYVAPEPWFPNPVCGPAVNEGPYTSIPPTDSLCTRGSLSGTVDTSANNQYKWICASGKKEVECTVQRVYTCGGTMPSSDGIITGSATYPARYSPTSWEYTSEKAPGSCQWTCAEGYKKGAGDTCDVIPAACGSATGSSHTGLNASSPNLCLEGTVGNFVSNNTQYTWTCTLGSNEPASCSAARVYDCGGTTPSGNGVTKGSATYNYGSTYTSWTYNTSLGACQWKCNNGYTQNGNTCVAQQPTCGTKNGGEFTSLSSNTSGLCGVGGVTNFESLTEKFSWDCEAGNNLVSCEAKRLYTATLTGDNSTMNNFTFGLIKVGSYYVMDRNLGATEQWDGVSNSSTYTPSYMGYFYEQGNNYGFSSTNIQKPTTAYYDASSVSNICSVVNSNVVPSSCSSSTYLGSAGVLGGWLYPGKDTVDYHHYESLNSLWGCADGGDVGYNTNEARKGPCPTGYHILSATEWDSVYNEWRNGNSYQYFNSGLSIPSVGYHYFAENYSTILYDNSPSSSPSLYWISGRHSYGYRLGYHYSYNHVWADGMNSRNFTGWDASYYESISRYGLYTTSQTNGGAVRCMKNY